MVLQNPQHAAAPCTKYMGEGCDIFTISVIKQPRVHIKWEISLRKIEGKKKKNLHMFSIDFWMANIMIKSEKIKMSIT